MTLNARNRMDRDRKLIFFIVGMGVLLIAIGLSLLLLYKLYGEDVKDSDRHWYSSQTLDIFANFTYFHKSSYYIVYFFKLVKRLGFEKSQFHHKVRILMPLKSVNVYV